MNSDNSWFLNEVTKAAKWYFYDNGVRNAAVNDFRRCIGIFLCEYGVSRRGHAMRCCITGFGFAQPPDCMFSACRVIRHPCGPFNSAGQVPS